MSWSWRLKMSWSCKFIALFLLQLVLMIWGLLHISQLANDLIDGKHIQNVFVTYIILLTNIGLIFGLISTWSLPALVWMASYLVSLIIVCERTLTTGRPYWTAGISYSASLQVSHWFNLSYSNYNVALIITLCHLFLVGLWVICLEAFWKSCREQERMALPTVVGVDLMRMDDQWFTIQHEWLTMQGSASGVNTNPIEIRTTEPRGNPNHDQPPTYSEAGRPPKYDESMTPQLVWTLTLSRLTEYPLQYYFELKRN